MVVGGELVECLVDCDVVLVWCDHEVGVGEFGDLVLYLGDYFGGGVVDVCYCDFGVEVDELVVVDVDEDVVVCTGYVDWECGVDVGCDRCCFACL